MNTLCWSVKASAPKYTVRMVCEKTGVEATVAIPIGLAEKEALVSRLSQAIGSMDTVRFEVEREKA